VKEWCDALKLYFCRSRLSQGRGRLAKAQSDRIGHTTEMRQLQKSHEAAVGKYNEEHRRSLALVRAELESKIRENVLERQESAGELLIKVMMMRASPKSRRSALE
jgi:hypothetical protein